MVGPLRLSSPARLHLDAAWHRRQHNLEGRSSRVGIESLGRCNDRPQLLPIRHAHLSQSRSKALEELGRQDEVGRPRGVPENDQRLQQECHDEAPVQ